MSKPETVILRDVARLVLIRGLDGRTFPAAIDRTRDRYGQYAPDAVRRIAVLVRWRNPQATSAEIARLLTEEAEDLEAAVA